MSVFLKSSDGASFAATSTSSTNSITGTGSVLRISHQHNAPIWVRVGIGAQTATITDFIVMPNIPELLRISVADDNIAIKSSVSGNVLVMRGEAF